MTFFTCHCWNRIPLGRSGWTRTQRLNWNSRPATTRSMSWRGSGTARYMRWSRKRAIYMGYTIWSLKKAIQKKKARGNQPWRCSIFENCSTSSIKRTLPSRQQPPPQLIPLRQWLGPLLSPPWPPNKSKAGQLRMTLTKRLKPPEPQPFYLGFRPGGE